MKSFKQFISEGINIQGDFNGTLNINSSLESNSVGEEFLADILYQGSIHRLSLVSESGIPSKQKLTDYLQGEYPGSIVHNIYNVEPQNSQFKINSSKRYHPSKLEWI